MPELTDALLPDKNGTLIAIEVSAGAKSGLFPAEYNPWRNTIGCRVTAPATGGKANRAVVEIISTVLCVPKTSVSIVSGHTSALKKVLVLGVGCTEVAKKLTGIKLP